jgi:hypothetical protein
MTALGQNAYPFKDLDNRNDIALGRHKGLPLQKFWNVLNLRSLGVET